MERIRKIIVWRLQAKNYRYCAQADMEITNKE